MVSDEYDEDELNEGDVKVEGIEILDNSENEEGDDVDYSDHEEDEEEDDQEDEVEDIEHVDTVDTFAQMENLYRPKNDTQVVDNEKVEIKAIVKDNKKEDVPVPEEEYEEEYDEEGSEISEEDIDDEEIDEEDISDVDDHDLMKRLESKYGKLPESKSSDEEEPTEKWTSNFKM